MKKEDLEQILSLKGEVRDLKRRLLSRKSKIISDSVKASSSNFPYTQHNCVIEGIDYKKEIKDKKYRRMIKEKQRKIDKKIKEAEYNLNYIKDSDIRKIIRHVYFDGKDYNQTAHIMNTDNPQKEYTADGIRMKLKRFFEKN